MAISEHQGGRTADANTRVRGWFNRLLFPVSVGAVIAEILAVFPIFVNQVSTLHVTSWTGWAGWVGLVAAVAVFVFESFTYKKR